MPSVIPQDDAERKAAPMFRGLLGYFPWALFKVAAHSYRSDRKHNPDTPEAEAPHWAREKSTDHADCIVRHLAEAHTDPDYHLVALAWRALALLQEHGERVHGVAPGVSSVFPTKKTELADLLHPAQKLAIEAFKRDYNGAETAEDRRAAVQAFVNVRDRVELQRVADYPIQTTVFQPVDRFAALKPAETLDPGPEDFGGDEYATD